MPKKIVTLFLLLSVIVGRELFLDGSFATHDDLQVMRLFQMHMCLSDGQIPCRYLSEMGFGYGQPTFNYYSAFPYYLGAFFNLLNISYLTTVKLLYFLNLFLAGCFFYKFARSHLSSVASFIAASAFVLVPYRAVDIFVRGALAEITALTLLPLLLYSFYKLSKEPKLSNTLFSSVILFFFLTTHNLTTLISLPLIIVYLLYLCLKNTSSLKHSFLASSLGVGLSAFFLLPVLFERNLINMAGLTSGYLDFHSHFSSLSQLFFDLSWPFEAKPSAFIGVIPSIVLFTSPLTIYFSKKRILP
ncbi:MAG: 6-pyruvoyl-tetrahydropterin synthase-related protein, partial [Patescibacteria group bacterium]